MSRDLTNMRFVPSVRLTLAEPAAERDVNLVISQFIAYAQKDGFTRLHLAGGKTLDVRETTDRIDYLIRSAAAGQRIPQQSQG